MSIYNSLDYKNKVGPEIKISKEFLVSDFVMCSISQSSKAYKFENYRCQNFQVCKWISSKLMCKIFEYRVMVDDRADLESKQKYQM